MINNLSSLISIIVPVYNTEKYLRKCIDSIIAQTNKDWELLLVDDGSKDESGKICDEYAVKDSRVRVFHKENGGVSSARNLALDNARGEWLAFVDSDDVVDKEYLSLERVADDTDVVIKSTKTFNENGEIKSKKQIISYRTIIDEDEIGKYYIRDRQSALWDKIIRRKVVGKRKFNENVKVGEDFQFFISCLSDVNKITFTPKGCYYYFIRQGSAMSKVSGKENRSRVDIFLQNINHVRRLTYGTRIEKIGRCILASNYSVDLYKYRSILTKDEMREANKIFDDISFSDLSYLSIKQKKDYYKAKIMLKFKAL